MLQEKLSTEWSDFLKLNLQAVDISSLSVLMPLLKDNMLLRLLLSSLHQSSSGLSICVLFAVSVCVILCVGMHVWTHAGQLNASCFPHIQFTACVRKSYEPAFWIVILEMSMFCMLVWVYKITNVLVCVCVCVCVCVRERDCVNMYTYQCRCSHTICVW